MKNKNKNSRRAGPPPPPPPPSCPPPPEAELALGLFKPRANLNLEIEINNEPSNIASIFAKQHSPRDELLNSINSSITNERLRHVEPATREIFLTNDATRVPLSPNERILTEILNFEKKKLTSPANSRVHSPNGEGLQSFSAGRSSPLYSKNFKQELNKVRENLRRGSVGSPTPVTSIVPKTTTSERNTSPSKDSPSGESRKPPFLRMHSTGSISSRFAISEQVIRIQSNENSYSEDVGAKQSVSPVRERRFSDLARKFSSNEGENFMPEVSKEEPLEKKCSETAIQVNELKSTISDLETALQNQKRKNEELQQVLVKVMTLKDESEEKWKCELEEERENRMKYEGIVKTLQDNQNDLSLELNTSEKIMECTDVATLQKSLQFCRSQERKALLLVIRLLGKETVDRVLESHENDADGAVKALMKRKLCSSPRKAKTSAVGDFSFFPVPKQEIRIESSADPKPKTQPQSNPVKTKSPPKGRTSKSSDETEEVQYKDLDRIYAKFHVEQRRRQKKFEEDLRKKLHI